MIHSGETGGFALARPALPALAARTSESWNTHCHGPHPRSLRLLPHIPPTHADSAQHPHVQTINNQDEYSQHGPVEGIGLRPTGKREQRKTNETFAETAQSMSRNLGLEYYYSHIPHPSCDITKLSLFFARFYLYFPRNVLPTVQMHFPTKTSLEPTILQSNLPKSFTNPRR